MYKRSKRSDTRSIIKERDILLSNIRRGSVVQAVSGGQQEAEEQEETSVSFEVVEAEDLNLMTDSGSSQDLESEPYYNRFSDSSDQESDGDLEVSLESQLATWVQQHMVTQSATDSLLKIIKPFVKESLPSCARTLMQTPRNLQISKKCGGEYFYFGIRSSVERRASSGLKLPQCRMPYLSSKDTKVLSISVGFDGVPVARSSNGQFWPLLGVVNQSIDQSPFLIALFYGHSKPCNLSEYLKEFIAEVKILKLTGIVIENVRYEFTISFFTADAPARSMLKLCKGHGGYHGCEGCAVEGDYVDHRVVFLEENCCERSDHSFEHQVDESHHTGVSPLLELGIGMVTQFPYDYMHLICLGVGRKMLLAMVTGNASKKVKLRSRSISIISDRLQRISPLFPTEFARRPRSLSELSHFKATEFRTFLLYSGPHCLKGVVEDEIYRHFLLLTTAIYILLSPHASNVPHNSSAAVMLRLYVKDCVKFYGEQFMTYNVHSLIHLAKDCLMYGRLDNFSAFGFENYMQTLKRYVQGKKHHLAQVVSRVQEAEHVFVSRNMTKTNGYVNKSSCKKFRYNNLLLSETEGDNCFLTEQCVIIITSLNRMKDGLVRCKSFKVREQVLDYPVDSRLLCIYRCYNLCEERYVSVTELIRKCVCLPTFENAEIFTCYPLTFDIEHGM